jgi:hypothetical protein
MILFIDFDSTLFAADEFIAYTAEHPDFAEELSRENLEAPFGRFLYGDVLSFLADARAEGYTLIIVTSAIDPDMQAAKIAATGIGPYVDRVIVVTESKGLAMKKLLEEESEIENEHYFIDDLPMFLTEVKGWLPNIHPIRIERRELMPFMEMKYADVAERVILSLDELREQFHMPIKNRTEE